MSEKEKPPTLSTLAGVDVILKKLNEQKKVTIKISANLAVQSCFLAQIASSGDFPKSPVLLVVEDELAKINLLPAIEFWLNSAAAKTKVKITGKINPAILSFLLKSKPLLLFASRDNLEESVVSPQNLSQHIINLKTDQIVVKKQLLAKLIAAGYDLAKKADAPGLVASRGSLVDIMPPDGEPGIRIDFDSDRIESIKNFNPAGGRGAARKHAAINPFNLNHLPKNSKFKNYLKEAKIIELNPFPVKPDAHINLTSDQIKNLEIKLRAGVQPAKKKNLSFIKKLKPGDLVVHMDHGIARFDGIVKERIDGREQEYFKLVYAQEDKLFLPVTMAEKIDKYIGEANPVLNRLSGAVSWHASVKKVRLDTLREARELLNTQARRQLAQTTAIARSREIEKSLARSFPFPETEDQKQAIAAIYEELASTRPMDRLICGDVGFGKTEIIVRAAAKAALAGQQTAILCPTTILTQQHLDTFQDRLKKMPINISSLSRFQSKQTQAVTIAGLKNGTIDIVIGTHRLLSSDVNFKNLNLIVIDEEQRFGVKHKEALKKLRSQAHVLTLTATPIPRTLHLGLSGVHDISVITTPPGGRLPIATNIEPYNHTKISDIIKKETVRGGQTYYLYNNIETINLKKQELQELLPKLKLAVLHGQLPEAQIAEVMHRFDKGEIDVLICSTIIENGLDLPNVNTLIVDNAPQFGLAQLHQIRGRIGRGRRQAYAYFFYKREKLTGEAKKRLEALEQERELGAGYDLALRDMEIRGVGNVLGRRQHGHVKSVGLGLYLKLLNQAVAEIKTGQPLEFALDIAIDLPLEARLPEFFEPDKQKRIEMYHQWAIIENIDELSKIKSDLQKDGALPQALNNLFYIFNLKILGRQAGITAIDTANESPGSPEQVIILKTARPIEPRLFARLLDVCPTWHYATDEIKIKKKDLGPDWITKLEKCVKLLVDVK